MSRPASGRPRQTIGSIDTSEFLIAVAASIGFMIGIGSESINYGWVASIAFAVKQCLARREHDRRLVSA